MHPSAADRRSLGHTAGLAIIEPDQAEAAGDAEWEAAWRAEIERRLRDFDEGRTTAISYEEFKRRVHARLPRR